MTAVKKKHCFRWHFNLFFNRFITFLLIFAVCFGFVKMPVKARALVGFDDAIIFGVLGTLIATAAGLTFTVGVNGELSTSSNPADPAKVAQAMSEHVDDYFATTSESLGDWVDNFDNFTGDILKAATPVAGVVNTIVNIPANAIEYLTGFVKYLVTDVLGSSSDTVPDFTTTDLYSSSSILDFDTIFLPLGRYNFNFSGTSSFIILSESLYCGWFPSRSSYYFGFFSNTYPPPVINIGSAYSKISLSSSSAFAYFYFATYGLFSSSSTITDSAGNTISLPFNDSLPASQSSVELEEMKYEVDDTDLPEELKYPDTTADGTGTQVESIPLITSIPWSDVGTGVLTGVAALEALLNPALLKAAENDLTAEYTEAIDDVIPANPTPVTIPILGVQLPDFNFNLKGIWYYVVQWVSSLRAWLGTMFNVWNLLPASMVYPVWASAVIVIVLGVYRRFFM